MYIGNIFVPYVENLTPNEITREIDTTIITDGEPALINEDLSSRSFNIDGVMCKISPNDVKDASDYANDIKAVGNQETAYNYIDYNGERGFLGVEALSNPLNSENQLVRDYSIAGKYFPLSKYQRYYRVELDYFDNDFNIKFPPSIALPVSTNNVIIKTAWDYIEAPLVGYLYGDNGELQVYQPYPMFDDLNSITMTHDVEFEESAHGFQVITTDTNTTTATWEMEVGVDIPKGIYKIVARVRDTANVASDVLLYTSGDSVYCNDTFTLSGTDWNLIESSEFQIDTKETVTFEFTKNTATTNTIYLDYAFIVPVTQTKLMFDIDQDYNNGEVKVYDKYQSIEKQIYDDAYTFHDTSVIKIENSLFSWEVDFAKQWINTGIFTNKVNDAVGRLYPKAFSENDVYFKIVKIRPDHVKIAVLLQNGLYDNGLEGGDQIIYNADAAKEVALITFYPHMINFQLDRNGTFNNDWAMEWDIVDDYLLSYCADGQVISSNSSNLDYASKNGNYIVTFETSILNMNKSIDKISTMTNDGGFVILSEDYKGNFNFNISLISNFIGNKYLFKSGTALTTTTETFLSYSDFTDADTTDRYNIVGCTATWNVDKLDIVPSAENGFCILKSYIYDDIEDIQVTVTKTDVTERSGVLLGYVDSDTYIWVGHYNERMSIYAKENTSAVEYMHSFDTPVTDLTTKIIVSFINNYAFITVTDESDVVLGTFGITPDFLTDENVFIGNVGIYSQGSHSFKNFSVNGLNIYNRGIQTNTILDDLNWDTTTEYIVNEGTLSNWTYNSSELAKDVDSSTSLVESNTLDNVQLKGGNYSCAVRIDASNAVERKSGFIFCNTEDDVATNMALVITLDSSDNARLELLKRGAYNSELGTYGVGGYGIYGYGGIGGTVILNYSDIEYEVGDWIVIECEFDDINHTYNCYSYQYGYEKPDEPNFVYTGLQPFVEGNVGLIAMTDTAGVGNIDASFKNLYITDTREATSVDGTFVCFGGVNHGARYGEEEYVNVFNRSLSNIEYAKHLLSIRTKTIDGSTSIADMYFENSTDAATLSLEKTDLYEAIATSADWAMQTEIIDNVSDNSSDIGFIGIKRHDVTDHDAPLMLVDFMSVMPIARNNDSDNIYSRDLAFISYNENNYKRYITKRESDSNYIIRLVSNFAKG